MEIIVGKSAGFCYGVERAVNGAKREAMISDKIYCLGEIVHNQNVIDELEQLGVKFVDNIEQVKDKAIIRAHGVSKDVYIKAEEKGIELQDLTCPSVLKIHKLAQQYSKKGYYIVLTGKKDHPEVIGIQSYCGKKYKIISNKEEIPYCIDELKKEKNILLISQTTYNSSKFDEISQILKKQINNNFEIKKTICPSTEIRQTETKDISRKVELMIIIGDRKSSNTNKLYDIANELCKNVIFIGNSDELDVSKLKNINKVGIMAGASTPQQQINNVKKKIEDINN